MFSLNLEAKGSWFQIRSVQRKFGNEVNVLAQKMVAV